MPRGRPKGSTNKSKTDEEKQLKTDSKEQVFVDFGDDLPKVVELKADETHKASGYKHELKGRFWRDGTEIVCVLLLEKHK